MGKELFAEILIPLAVKGRSTYRIPGELSDKVFPGSLVIVQFGSKRLYSGIVGRIFSEVPGIDNLKDISEVIDQSPVIFDHQLKLWEWISEYYMCTPGEVLKAAIPSGLAVESETFLQINPLFTELNSLSRDAMVLFSMIENRNGVHLKRLPHLINEAGTIRIINELVVKNAVIAGETLTERYKPREEVYIILSHKYTDSELNAILDKLSKAPRQYDVLAAYIRITGYCTGKDLFPVKKNELIKQSGALPSGLTSLINKGILTAVRLETSRVGYSEIPQVQLRELSEAQSEAFDSVSREMKEKDIVLLHGVTSSGKTEIYIHLIEEQLKLGKQVLYLLPEIALTTQIIERLRKHFGKVTGVYHSRFNDAEKVEIWKKVSDTGKKNGYDLILGVRSSVFLPFRDLGLVIVDEEHDGSYKQHDPAPRYHARDTAIILASLFGARTLLGSATPSVESFHNARTGKYGYVELKERFGKINLPEIIIANTREASKRKLMVSHFSPQLLNAIDQALSKKEQVILFRNRRGFSPWLECTECGWIPSCGQCAVKLTYHKDFNRLICHYCGTSTSIPPRCGNCGGVSMKTIGFGTEKIEDEIRLIFPSARVARMDQDTTRNKNSFSKIFGLFESGQTDILIGTQMISKGLDFENLTVVGILNADSMLNFPDFRSHERAFQLMSQVSGRAGRRQKHGKVILQTADPENKIIRYVLNHDFTAMYSSQIEERKIFNYPPFCRLIRIVIRHKDQGKLNELSAILGDDLRATFGKRVMGPEFPMISRIQSWYIKNILIKIERERPLQKAKQLVHDAIERTENGKGASVIRIHTDVDPY